MNMPKNYGYAAQHADTRILRVFLNYPQLFFD